MIFFDSRGAKFDPKWVLFFILRLKNMKQSLNSSEKAWCKIEEAFTCSWNDLALSVASTSRVDCNSCTQGSLQLSQLTNTSGPESIHTNLSYYSTKNCEDVSQTCLGRINMITKVSCKGCTYYKMGHNSHSTLGRRYYFVTSSTSTYAGVWF